MRGTTKLKREEKERINCMQNVNQNRKQKAPKQLTEAKSYQHVLVCLRPNG